MTEFVLANPHSRVFEAGGVTWLVSGSDPDLFEKAVKRSCEKGLETREILLEVSAGAEEGSFAAVEDLGGGTQRTTLLKGLPSTFDLYYRVDGATVLVFDHFRNALASIPAGERIPDRDAFADLLLFSYAYLPGSHSLVRGVGRMAPGQMVVIGPEGGTASWQAETLALPGEGRGPGPEEAVDRLEGILRERVETYAASYGKPAVLLSGGVDSTLVLSCLGKGASAVTIGIDTPEYVFEMEYARMAASLLEAGHTLRILEESSYRGLAREIVEALGQPTDPAFFQPMAFHEAFRGEFAFFLYGETVDSLLGFNKLAKIFDEASLSPGERKALGAPPEDLSGYAARCGLSPDFETVRGILGEEVTENRLAGRLDYALGICPGLAGLGPERRRAGHAEAMSIFTGFGHIRQYIGRTRQQALSAGRTVLSPFACRSFLDLGMSIPMPDRILKDGVVKHLAKSLLARRLPSYPVFTRKGGSDIPRTRFLQEGPLKDIFLEEKPPRFWPEEHRDLLFHPRRESSFAALNALGYALWQNHVLENPDFEPVPGTRSFRVETNEENPA